MVKPENYEKITGNARNLPEKSLKNAKNFPPNSAQRMVGGGGGSGFAGQGGFANFFDDRGFGSPSFGYAWVK